MNDVEHKQIIITRNLPKTGQSISYYPKDDGEYEAGWWKGKLNVNNKQRFIAKTIGGDAVVIDRATGLMWPANGIGAGCSNGEAISWQGCIIFADELVFAGFSDWRLPNVRELCSLVDYSRYNPSLDPILFPNTHNAEYWTSTSLKLDTSYKWQIGFGQGTINYDYLGSEYYVRPVRGGI